MFGKRSGSALEGHSGAVAPPKPAPTPLPIEPQAAAAAAEERLAPLPSAGLGAPIASPATAPRSRNGPAASPPPPPPPSSGVDVRRSEAYYETKSTIFSALIEAIDLGQLTRLDAESAREEIRDIVNEIIAIKNIVMSIAEQEELLDDICNDILG